VLAVTTWQWLFFLNLPLGGLALALSFSSLPRTPLIPGKFDALGTFLLAAGLGTFLIGLDSFAHKTALVLSLALLALGATALSLMLRRQSGQKTPLLPVDLLALPKFRAAFLTGFTAFVASNFFIISMPFNLMTVLHRSATATGLLITPWPVAIAVVAPVVGRLADRFTAATLSTIGLLITASGFFALYLLPAHPSDADIAWRIFLAGAGFGIFQPPNNKAMMTEAPASRTGSASGMVSVGRLLGQTIGGILVALTLGLIPHGGTTMCLLLGTITACLAAGVSGARIKQASTSFCEQKEAKKL
jgi:DHA2 family multidrug resistance protein-like MFS transporter